jgi:predicted nuclease of predicted toxin-antitoxin system
VKFLLDVCVSSRSLESFLVREGHDALSVVAIDPKASDEKVLDFAEKDDRVLITEDKDFGELVFVRGLSHGPIVRLVELTVDEQLKGMGELLDQHAADLTERVIVTVTRRRIRIRK